MVLIRVSYLNHIIGHAHAREMRSLSLPPFGFRFATQGEKGGPWIEQFFSKKSFLDSSDGLTVIRRGQGPTEQVNCVFPANCSVVHYCETPQHFSAWRHQYMAMTVCTLPRIRHDKTVDEYCVVYDPRCCQGTEVSVTACGCRYRGGRADPDR